MGRDVGGEQLMRAVLSSLPVGGQGGGGLWFLHVVRAVSFPWKCWHFPEPQKRAGEDL